MEHITKQLYSLTSAPCLLHEREPIVWVGVRAGEECGLGQGGGTRGAPGLTCN